MPKEKNENVPSTAKKMDLFREIVVMTDDQTWIWGMISNQLERLGRSHVRIPTSVPIRSSWPRFSGTDFIILHWEGKERGGGAIIEEILEIDRVFDVRSRIIVLTTNPTHEDVVYFSELGVRNIVRIRNREKDISHTSRELSAFLLAERLTEEEILWNKVLHKIDQFKFLKTSDLKKEELTRLETTLSKLIPPESTARYLDALASLLSLQGQDEKALQTWKKSLSINPNYVRSYHNMIIHYRQRNALKEAYTLLQKMYELNKANISRLVDMGEIQSELGDQGRAEFYFQSALSRDPYASRALNGLAEIRFNQGDLETSRELLAKSQMAHKTAHNLNKHGVLLVQKGKFQEALEHYRRAQYVLPQQDKGPLLLYNIALCYIKWKKPSAAFEYLRLALIKDPTYEKALKLLSQIEKFKDPRALDAALFKTGAISPQRS